MTNDNSNKGIGFRTVSRADTEGTLIALDHYRSALDFRMTSRSYEDISCNRWFPVQ